MTMLFPGDSLINVPSMVNVSNNYLNNTRVIDGSKMERGTMVVMRDKENR